VIPPVALDLAAALPLLLWVYLLAARGGFWRISRALAPRVPRAPPGKRVIAVIPARNEADVIAQAVESLLGQDRAVALEVIVVDDGSTDGTAAAAQAAAARAGASARVTVIPGALLARGWSGKLWALAQGVQRALERAPDFLLLTDADVRHGRADVAALVAIAEAEGRDLVSYMVRLSVRTLAERWLIPAFVFFFFEIYPPAWVASPRARTAAAAGGCILIRPGALARAGGLTAIRAHLIDDCALAAAVKASGGSVRLALAETAESIRPYGSLAEIGRMISRSAFNQLRHSYALLAATLAGLALAYALPLAFLIAGDPLARVLGALSWALMTLLYAPMVRFYRLSVLWSLTLPAIALFYAAATVHSAVEYTRGRGGRWKGRVQDARASGAGR